MVNEDDEILLKCKTPNATGDSNVDLRPVTKIGFDCRFSTD